MECCTVSRLRPQDAPTAPALTWEPASVMWMHSGQPTGRWELHGSGALCPCPHRLVNWQGTGCRKIPKQESHSRPLNCELTMLIALSSQVVGWLSGSKSWWVPGSVHVGDTVPRGGLGWGLGATWLGQLQRRGDSLCDAGCAINSKASWSRTGRWACMHNQINLTTKAAGWQRCVSRAWIK